MLWLSKSFNVLLDYCSLPTNSKFLQNGTTVCTVICLVEMTFFVVKPLNDQVLDLFNWQYKV